MIKTRLSVAILAATLALTGCIGDDEQEQAVTESYVGFDPVVAAADNANLPAAQQRGPVIPFPFDALFAGAKTPTLNIPNAGGIPFVTNANLQDGFSTTASMFMDIFGFVNMATVKDYLMIVEVKPQVNPPFFSLSRLTYGDGEDGTGDYTIRSSTVKDGSGVPINAQRTRLLIEPLKPLNPSTTYIVALKKGIKTLNGGMVQPSYMFNFLNSDTPIANVTDSYFKRFSATEKANLEALRSQLVRKSVNMLKTKSELGVTDNNVLLAYTVTTQSTTKTLDKVAAATVASDIAAVPIGQTVKQVLEAAGQAVPPNADQTDVYVGTLKVPYYGNVPSEANPTAILSSYWKADATMPDLTAKATAFQIPCTKYDATNTSRGTLPDGQMGMPSTSTTTCFPTPVKQSDQTLPMIVTVPKGAKPDGGWPVVIFQHGITRNRTDIFAIASTYAKAGFATVAIDLPLHGLPSTNPFYKNQLLAGSPAAALMTSNERTFDVDSTGKPASGASVVGSGTHFINLASPITTRDSLRQGASDILVLAKSLANLNVDGVAGGDINMSQVRFSGISLGAIVGTVALGADKSASLIGAASLSVGSGALPKLLDGSKSFGPVIAAGLQGSGVLENTDSYETFMRFAQTLADAGDPINFAMAAKMNRSIHFTQVLNDLVVSNASIKGAASATQDFVGATGFLSGNTALAKTMGFSTKNEIEITAFNSENLTGNNTWVQFNQGSHGSLLDPTSNAGVTVEMQCQSAGFFATNGAVVPVGCSKP